MPGCCKTIIRICCCCLFWRQRRNTNNNITAPAGPRPRVGGGPGSAVSSVCRVHPSKPDENELLQPDGNTTRSSLASPPNPPQSWQPDANAQCSSSASPPHPPRQI